MHTGLIAMLIQSHAEVTKADEGLIQKQCKHTHTHTHTHTMKKRGIRTSLMEDTDFSSKFRLIRCSVVLTKLGVKSVY